MIFGARFLVKFGWWSNSTVSLYTRKVMSLIKVIVVVVIFTLISFWAGMQVNSSVIIEKNTAIKSTPLSYEPEKNSVAVYQSNNSDNDKLIQDLKIKLKNLERNYEELVTRLDVKENDYLSNIEPEKIEESIQPRSSITLAEVEPYLPEPFANTVSESKGTVVDLFKKLQAEEVDYDWAVEMEQKIKDYFVTHDLAGEVNLQSVNCKKTICEIRGFEKSNNVVGVIISGMHTQVWWNFNGSHKSTGSNEKDGLFFYMLASRKV